MPRLGASNQALARETALGGSLVRGRPETSGKCLCCGRPIAASGTGRPRRFCAEACRKKAARRARVSGTGRRVADGRPINRDEAVMRLAAIIAGEDGVRVGFDALSRFFEDRRAALAATPLWWRQELAGRIVDVLGLGEGGRGGGGRGWPSVGRPAER